MQRYSVGHLDPLFIRDFGQKLQQYRLLGGLPPGTDTRGAVIGHTLQLLQDIHPILATVLDAELRAGNRVRTACDDFPYPGMLTINLLKPFARRYKAKKLDFLLVKDPHDGPDPAHHYSQYTTPLAPAQYLTASIQ